MICKRKIYIQINPEMLRGWRHVRSARQQHRTGGALVGMGMQSNTSLYELSQRLTKLDFKEPSPWLWAL